MAAVCATGSASVRGAGTSLAAHNNGLSQAAASVTRSHSEAGCSTSSKIGGLPCRTLVIDHPISSRGRTSASSKGTEGGKPGASGQSQQFLSAQAPVVYTCRHEVNGWSVVGLMTRRRRAAAAAAAGGSLRRALGAPASDCVATRRGRGRSSRVCSARAEASATSASAGASAPCADERQSSAEVAESAPSSSNGAETAETHLRTAAQAGASLRKVVRSLDPSTGEDAWRPLRVLVVGAGIGGLVFALAAKKKGIHVQVFERDTSAIRGEGQYRGPIQIQSNALAALEAIDQEVAERVMHEGTVTGDRVNGLVDGLTGEWYIKFDTWHPAVSKGLPVTRVISRMTLQEILSQAVGTDIIQGSSNVVDYEDDGEKVVAILDDGRRVEGDLLVGADGIRSKVRVKLLGPTEATYSDYTCYTGIADFVPIDIDTVGYRVFLGSKQYFVSSDVGHGKMQWYAFHYQEAGQEDPPGPRKEMLLQMFTNWCDEVVDLLLATPEEMILRRDIYDRIPIVNWSKGRVTLLGDSAHAMQPNMGQGGCMAIEDAYELALDIDKAIEEVEKRKKDHLDVGKVLKQYENARRLRVAAIHGLARMAAIMASTYITFLGGGLSLPWLMKLRIPHPGRVFGKIFMSPTMPLMLDWVLGGYSTNLENRAPYCRIEDKATYNFDEHLKDDELLYRTTTADWTLMRLTDSAWWKSLQEGNKREQWKISDRSGEPVIVGSSPATSARGTPVAIDLPVIAKHQVKFTMRNGLVFVEDLPESTGTLLNGAKLRPGSPVRIRPGDVMEMGGENQEKVKLRVRLEKSSEVLVA